MPTAFVDRNRSRARRSWAYVASGSTGRSTSIRRTNSVCAILGSIRFTGGPRARFRRTKAFAVDYHVNCRESRQVSNSGVRAIPRVPAGAANDLAMEFEGRSAADVARGRRTGIDVRGRRRLCRVHAGPPKAFEGKRSVALLGWSLQVLQGHHRGVSAWGPRHPAARMGAAPAQVEALYGSAVGRPPRDRSQGEQLVRRHVGLVDAASG